MVGCGSRLQRLFGGGAGGVGLLTFFFDFCPALKIRLRNYFLLFCFDGGVEASVGGLVCLQQTKTPIDASTKPSKRSRRKSLRRLTLSVEQKLRKSVRRLTPLAPPPKRRCKRLPQPTNGQPQQIKRRSTQWIWRIDYGKREIPSTSV